MNTSANVVARRDVAPTGDVAPAGRHARSERTIASTPFRQEAASGCAAANLGKKADWAGTPVGIRHSKNVCSAPTLVVLLMMLSPSCPGMGEALPAALPQGGALNWTVMTDAFGAAVDYPASIFTAPAPPPPRGTGQSLVSEDGSARFMMYAERNDDHLTPEQYIRRNLAGPQSQLEYRRVSDRFFAISSVSRDDIFYSRCNFPDGAAGFIHCIFLSYPKNEKRAWDDIVTRMSLSLRSKR